VISTGGSSSSARRGGLTGCFTKDRLKSHGAQSELYCGCSDNVHPNFVLPSTLGMLAWPGVITDEHHIKHRFGKNIQTSDIGTYNSVERPEFPAVPLDINFTRMAPFSSQKLTVMIFHL
jgi:hypothetical protein